MTSTIIDATRGSITFSVDDVEPARDPLPDVKPRLAIWERTNLHIESADDLAKSFVPARGHGLVRTVERAFLDHRPLILGPDAVWQTIAQGFADHVSVAPESLRARLVPHEGRRVLVVPIEYLQRCPENPWRGAFEGMAQRVRECALPSATEALEVDFSTSTPVDRVARTLVLLDAFQSYFTYVFACICGIPWVRLEGTPSDWELILQKLDVLARYDLGWWTGSIAPVIRELWKTARGEPDAAFWRSIFQRRDEGRGYGGPVVHVSGWIVRLVPYLGEPGRLRRNPLVLGEAQEVRPQDLPKGHAQVPFFLVDERGATTKMVAIAGIFGMDQEAFTNALRPRMLWAVAREPAEAGSPRA